jgi:hypothetical protein
LADDGIEQSRFAHIRAADDYNCWGG